MSKLKEFIEKTKSKREQKYCYIRVDNKSIQIIKSFVEKFATQFNIKVFDKQIVEIALARLEGKTLKDLLGDDELTEE